MRTSQILYRYHFIKFIRPKSRLITQPFFEIITQFLKDYKS